MLPPLPSWSVGVAFKAQGLGTAIGKPSLPTPQTRVTSVTSRQVALPCCSSPPWDQSGRWGEQGVMFPIPGTILHDISDLCACNPTWSCRHRLLSVEQEGASPMLDPYRAADTGFEVPVGGRSSPLQDLRAVHPQPHAWGLQVLAPECCTEKSFPSQDFNKRWGRKEKRKWIKCF